MVGAILKELVWLKVSGNGAMGAVGNWVVKKFICNFASTVKIN